MSHEVAETNANMQEIARLRADLAAANDRATAAQHALDSARAYADEVEQECVELRDRALGILRAARLLVAAWREERRKAKMWEEGTLMLISGWEWAEDAPEAPTEPPAQPQGGAAGE